MTEKKNTTKDKKDKKEKNIFCKDNKCECNKQSAETKIEENELQDEKQLEENIKSELEILNDQYIRLAADFDNYRKRQAQERESLLKYGAEDTLKKLLPILDTFERAGKSISEIDDPEKIKESFNILQKQFLEALEKVGLQKIESVGKEFNPACHEAVMQTPTNEHTDNTVMTELQSGYKLNDRILRPALVNVAVNQ